MLHRLFGLYNKVISLHMAKTAYCRSCGEEVWDQLCGNFEARACGGALLLDHVVCGI